MFQCTFILNSQPSSDFIVGGNRHKGGIRFSAFSGLGESVNKRAAACQPDAGPIPPGRYYIFDRETGGRLGWARDLIRRDKGDWFALYKEDAAIDDRMLCDSIERGNFRLHPKGPRGISKGCITINKMEDFRHLSSILLSQPPQPVQGSQLLAYGIVTVS